MNTERFFEAMAFKLSLDQKKLDDKLERVVNSDMPLEKKLDKVGSLLQKMVNLEGMVKKFNEMVQMTNNNNKENTKTKEN